MYSDILRLCNSPCWLLVHREGALRASSLNPASSLNASRDCFLPPSLPNRKHRGPSRDPALVADCHQTVLSCSRFARLQRRERGAGSCVVESSMISEHRQILKHFFQGQVQLDELQPTLALFSCCGLELDLVARSAQLLFASCRFVARFRPPRG